MSDKRILTTHVGSLARPEGLLDWMGAIEKGVAVDDAAFDAYLAKAVAEVVKQQEKSGVDIVSDGEFGKFRSWSFYVIDRLGGIEERAAAAPGGQGKDQKKFPEFYAQYFPTQKLPKRGVFTCVGPVTYKGQAAIKRDIDHLKRALPERRLPPAFSRLLRRRARCRRMPTSITRTMKSFSSRSPMRCVKNTRR
jgi:5-methyltetrahydropteroyltriglutamate--homocysteine methyltransferase